MVEIVSNVQMDLDIVIFVKLAYLKHLTVIDIIVQEDVYHVLEILALQREYVLHRQLDLLLVQQEHVELVIIKKMVIATKILIN